MSKDPLTPDVTISQTAFGREVGVSVGAINQLAARGILTKVNSSGGLNFRQALLDYCAHLRSVAGNGSGSVDLDLDLTAERARKAKEEADRLEMQNALLRGELLKREDVDAAVIGAFARVRARLISVPAKVAPLAIGLDTPAEIEAEVRRGIYDALRELSETAIGDIIGNHGDVVEDPGPTA